ncbi:MAG TPA: hypothetical protein DIW47_00920 [Bacteroidetes bacterium]|nr:hypothetical protein [Bacteroidota bacterium]
MNNENLNDFYNQNRFNKKLRERIDSYEPELSDSLWDRIEHGLVKKESRSKRMVWMVYVMAGLLLISGAGLYYLASENKKLADAVKTKDKLAPKGLNQEAPAFEYTMPETTVEISPESSGTQSTPNGSDERGTTYLEPVPAIEEVYQERLREPITFDLFPEPPAEPVDQEIPATSSIGNKEFAPFFYTTNRMNPPFLKENISTKGLIHPKIQPYIGLTSELGSTRQKLEGTHAYRFNHEHPLLYRSAGLKAGVLFRSGLYIESGLSFSNTGSNLLYDFVPSNKPDTVPGRDPLDSLITGSKHAVNQQYWMDIPVQVGYRYSLNSHWSLNSQVGLTYSMINSYNGYEPNENFTDLDQAGESAPQPFQNYWSMNVGLGFGYQFARNWSLDIQGNYRKGLTEMNRESRPNHPDRIAEFLNAKVGIAYIFR